MNMFVVITVIGLAAALAWKLARNLDGRLDQHRKYMQSYEGKSVVILGDTLKILYYDTRTGLFQLENTMEVSVKFLDNSKILDNVKGTQ